MKKKLIFYGVVIVTGILAGGFAAISWGGELERSFMSFRRIRDVQEISQIRLGMPRDGTELKVNFSRFPDGEIYVRIADPQRIQGESITVLAPFKSEDDFMKMFLTLGALKQYGAKNISLVIDGWHPQTPEDERFISVLKLFSDDISVWDATTVGIKRLNISAPPTFSKITEPIHIDRVAYIQPRFKQDVEEAVGRIKDAKSSFIDVKQASEGYWTVNNPSDLAGKNVVLIHSTETSRNILELLLALSSLRDAAVNSVSLINTYQGYARQERENKEGEGVSAHMILSALNRFLDRNFSINVHYAKGSDMDISLAPEIWVTENGNKKIINRLQEEKVYNLNGFVQLGEKLMEIVKNGTADGKLQGVGEEEFKKHPILLLAPDDGAFRYAQEAAKAIKEYKEKYGEKIDIIAGYLDKERVGSSKVKFVGPVLGEAGQELKIKLDDYWTFILDDETSTGGTVKGATYHIVQNLGADKKKIYSGVVHGKFATGLEEFYITKDEEMLPQIIIALDTLPLPSSITSASSAPLISYAIKRILGK